MRLAGCCRGRIRIVVVASCLVAIGLVAIGLRWETHKGPEQRVRITSLFGKQLLFEMWCSKEPARREAIWFEWSHPMQDPDGGRAKRVTMDRNGDGRDDYWSRRAENGKKQVRIDVDLDGRMDLQFETDPNRLTALLKGLPGATPCVPEYPCSRIFPYGLTAEQAELVCGADEAHRREFWWNVGLMEAIALLPRRKAENLSFQLLFSESDDVMAPVTNSAGDRQSPARTPSGANRGEKIKNEPEEDQK